MRKWHLHFVYQNFICILHLMQYVVCQTCSHKSPSLDQVVRGVHIEPHHVMKRRAIDQPLRIFLYYDDSIAALPLAQQDLIKNDLIASSVPYWERTLSVRHTESAIKLQRQCIDNLVKYKPNGDLHAYCARGCVPVTRCGETAVPMQHLDVCRQSLQPFTYDEVGEEGEGVNDTDFILYVSANDTPRCGVGTTVAYSAYCQQEMAFDRPVAGYVNLCPHAISTKIHHLNQMHSTMRHEILHALGFSVGLFAFFRDDDGNPLTERLPSTNAPEYNSTLEVYQWSDKIIKTLTRPEWRVQSGLISRQINVIVTPRVLEEVRKHFNCSTLEGAELEDQDSIGTAYSHWEKRIFENEAMTGGYTQNPLISRITLALMEDTGWYRADYSMAEPLKWGAGLGCDFVKKSCADWMQLQREKGESIHPFCDIVKRSGALHTECTHDYSAVAVCNLVRHESPLLLQYQYFDSIEGVSGSDVTFYGGSVKLADYCPFIQEFNWKSAEGETVRTSSCVAESYIELSKNYMLEEFGGESKCFEHHRPWNIQHCDVTHVVDNWGSGCYKMRCDSVYGLIVIVHGMEYQCVNEGDVILISQSTSEWYHEGSIICPACHVYCKNELVDGCPVVTDRIPNINDLQANPPPCTYQEPLEDSAKMILIKERTSFKPQLLQKQGLSQSLKVSDMAGFSAVYLYCVTCHSVREGSVHYEVAICDWPWNALPAVVGGLYSSRDCVTSAKRFSHSGHFEKHREFLSAFPGGSVNLTKDENNGIAFVTINHSARRNAFSGAMMVQLADVAQELNTWKDGKGFILRGAERTFCSGGDLTLMKKIITVPNGGEIMCEFMQHTLTSLFHSHLVSVAVIEGPALGGGAEVATSCDFRVAAPDAKIGFVQSQMGLTTGWGGGSRLVHLVGRTRALELLTSAHILTAEQALDVGLVDGIIPSDNAADEAVLWLKERTRGEPVIIQGFKSTVVGATENTLSKSLDIERRVFASVFGGEAQIRALNKGTKHK